MYPNMAALELSKVVGFNQEGFIDFIFGRVMRQSDYRLPEDNYALDKVAEGPTPRLVINDDLSYILYHTICDPMAALELSKVVGLTLEGFIDFIFGRVMRQSDYRLPEDNCSRLWFNADFVAQKDPDMFTELVYWAKYFGLKSP